VKEVLIEEGILDEVVRKLDIMEEIVPLITDLGWEYDRMSADGKDSFDKIEKLLLDMGIEVPASVGVSSF
tara:strand:+ start:971 stop:1180 length:210 start_codon:yes stop_codon:yes gene_type:complete